MNNVYITKTKTITDALEIIDDFRDKMNMFQDKYSKYKYDVNLKKLDNDWEVTFNITNEKETNK